MIFPVVQINQMRCEGTFITYTNNLLITLLLHYNLTKQNYCVIKGEQKEEVVKEWL